MPPLPGNVLIRFEVASGALHSEMEIDVAWLREVLPKYRWDGLPDVVVVKLRGMLNEALDASEGVGAFEVTA